LSPAHEQEYVNPAKKIPAWAAPGALSEALERQLTGARARGRETASRARDIRAWQQLREGSRARAAAQARALVRPTDAPAPAWCRALQPIRTTSGKPAKERYNRRGSSGNWKADQLTWKEVHEYNQAMGYYKGQQG
jgi:hypothetical protein